MVGHSCGLAISIFNPTPKYETEFMLFPNNLKNDPSP